MVDHSNNLNHVFTTLESSKIHNLRNSNHKTCIMPTKYQQFQVEILNWPKQITEAIIICIIQHFEADFLWKVSLKFLKSGKIPKTVTSENSLPRNCGIIYFQSALCPAKGTIGTDYSDQPAHPHSLISLQLLLYE